MNPLLTPAQYEDRFTNPALDKRDESQYCIVTLPAYVQVQLATPPSMEPGNPVESGFESHYLQSPANGARPSFRRLYKIDTIPTIITSGLMAYPRPTVVSNYTQIGETVNRHGKKTAIRAPVYTHKRKGFYEYLKHPKRSDDRYKFSRGTLHQVICETCLPTEGESKSSIVVVVLN
jgi:hypothetical protein